VGLFDCLDMMSYITGVYTDRLQVIFYLSAQSEDSPVMLFLSLCWIYFLNHRWQAGKLASLWIVGTVVKL